MIALIADHLWQSTVFAALAALLTVAFRSHRAHVRCWLWLAASVKFLVPFAALVAIGRQFKWRPAAMMTQPVMTFLTGAVGQSFTQVQLRRIAVDSARTVASEASALPIVFLAIWCAGSAVMLVRWWVGWRRVAVSVREASTVEQGRELETLRRLEQRAAISRPLPIVASDGSFEPGVFGILNPVLMWPMSIGDRLADAQVEAILAHEIAHVRRRDNLAAAVHMFVQTVFWFHPLVWWIGGRLLAERERACDEEVVGMGSEPQVYAESILKTCEFYIEAPLVCVAGVTGSNLKKRIEAIMRGRATRALSPWRRSALAAAGVAAIGGPLMLGVLTAPPLRAQVAIVQPPAGGGSLNPVFEVASIKPNKSGDPRVMIGIQPGGRFSATNVPLRMLIRNAYQLQDFQISGGPAWLGTDRFDIVAKADRDLAPAIPGGPPAPMQLMLRALLTDRFKLVVHHDTRELPIYALVLARSDRALGPQLRLTQVDCAAMALARGRAGAPTPGLPPLDERPVCGMRIGPGQMSGGGFPLSQLTGALAPFVQQVVVDRTGLTGNYDIDLKWTPDQMPSGPRPADAPALAAIDPNGPSIFTAIQEQLGLKLDSQRGPVDVLVIDRAEPPTEN